MFEELLRHTDTGIFHGKFIGCVLLHGAWLFPKPYNDISAWLGKLDCITHDINQYLIQPQLICYDIFMHNILRINIEIQVLRINQPLYHRSEIMQELRKMCRFFVKLNHAVLDTAHIQNIIDQAQQMRA